MFKVTVFFIILGIMGLALGYELQAADNTTGADNEPEYVIGSGDEVEVTVWNHPEFARKVRIKPDGKISLPLIKDITANGVTPSKLTQAITDQLSKYIKEPKVSVIVTDYKSKKILVIGAINGPGLYQYEGNMTVFDAMGMAGGYNPHAQLKSILVIRGAADSDKPKFYVANLYRAIHDGDITQNVVLQPKDIIYVPKNFIGNFDDFLGYYFSKIQPIASSYLFYQTFEDEINK
jgi:polysaccharide export outer membrane protein